MATQEELLRQQQQNIYSQAQDQIQPATTVTTATYIDDSGNKQFGLVQPNADTSGYYDRMRDYQGQIYADTLASNAKALEDAQKRAREAADAQREALTQGYQGTNRQLYRDYMEHRRTLPQEMAAAGYSGGLSESSNIRLRNSYEEALAQNERARLTEEAGIESNFAQQAYEAEAARRAADQQARQNQYSYLMALEEARYQQQQQELANRANTMAATGDFSAYAQLGYSQDEIDALTRMWLQQNPTLKDTWIKNHPEDAERLGLTGQKRSGGGGTYTAAPKTYTLDQKNAAALNALTEGVSATQLISELTESVASGEMSREEANAIARNVAAAAQSGNGPATTTATPAVTAAPATAAPETTTRPATTAAATTVPSGWTGNEPEGGGAIATALANMYNRYINSGAPATPAQQYDLYQQALARGGY